MRLREGPRRGSRSWTVVRHGAPRSPQEGFDQTDARLRALLRVKLHADDVALVARTDGSSEPIPFVSTPRDHSVLRIGTTGKTVCVVSDRHWRGLEDAIPHFVERV